MRKKFLLCICLVNYCLFLSTALHAQLQKLYINPKAPATEKQSRIVDSIRFIPLQQREETGVSGYSYVEPTENYFLIKDYSAKAVVVYKKNGDFVKRIDYKKLGESFHPDYQRHSNQLRFFGANKKYALTPKDEIQISLDWANPRNKKYYKKYVVDLADNTFAIKEVDPDENDIVGANYYRDDHYWQGKIITSVLYKDSLDYELKVYRNNSLVKSFFPYNHINEPRFLYLEQHAYLSETEVPAAYLLTRPYCDTIYKLANDSLFPVCQLVLPLENSLPKSFFTTAFKNKTERGNFERNNAWMFQQVYNFYETPRFISFNVKYLGNYEAYIYQKQGAITYKTINIKPDSSQYNLKLLDDFGIVRQGEKFYKTVKAADLLLFFEQHKSVSVPKELRLFLQRNPQHSAPVIVEFKLKN